MPVEINHPLPVLQPLESRRLPLWKSLLALTVSLILILGLLPSLWIPIFDAVFDPLGLRTPATASPEQSFHDLTGWTLPTAAQVLQNVNTHDNFINDGTLTLVVQVAPKQLQQWLSDSRDPVTWRACPIAAEILQQAHGIPEHDGQLYYARKTDITDRDWHRGHVVIVNPDSGLIWIHEWKW